MKTRRPDDLPFPHVWKRFTRTSPEGKEVKFKIQDCPNEMLGDLLEFMCEYFMKDETLNNAVGIQYDNLAVEEFRSFQSVFFPQKLAVICVKDDDGEIYDMKTRKPQILGFSLTFVQRNEEDQEVVPKSNAIVNLFKIFNEMESRNTTCKTYDIKEYLGDAGLSVHPSVRHLGIGKELLESRILIAKALGLKVIEATFTSDASQASARRAGYSELVSVPYAELTEKYGIDFKTSSKYIQIMTYVVERNKM